MAESSTSSSSTNNKIPEKLWTPSRSLSEYLWQSPDLFQCRLTQEAKRQILTRCYESLWEQDQQRMLHYFFATYDEYQQSLSRLTASDEDKDNHMNIDQQQQQQQQQQPSWHSNTYVPQQDLSSQRGRQCGHVFRKGEPVYRCRNCGLDETCVFCSTCFHATDHDGHDVLFSISPGSGGCCDCGDPEAWKVPLQCKVHAVVHQYTQSPTFDVEPHLVTPIHNTVAVLLDFLLDTFALAPDEVALPSSTEEVIKENHHERIVLERIGVRSKLNTKANDNEDNNGKNNTMDDPFKQRSNMDTKAIIEEDVDMVDKEYSDTLRDKSKADWTSDSDYLDGAGKSQDSADELYACIAWNDEAHAFSHVLESIMSATGYDWEKAKRIVDVIHVHGREVIALSNNVDELRKIAAPLAAINLGVTIRPARSTFREQVCGILVEWLKELVCGQVRFFTQVPGGDALVRNVLCRELCAEWELRLPLAVLTTGSRTSRNVSDVVDIAQTGIRVGGDNGPGGGGVAPNGDDGFPIIVDLDLEPPTTTLPPTTTTTTRAIPVPSHSTAAIANEDVDMFESDGFNQYQSQFMVGSPASTSSSPVVYRNQCDVATIDWDPAAMVREYQSLRIQEDSFNDYLEYQSTSVVDGKKPVTIPQETMIKAKNMQKEFEEKLRIDYFMLYDLKLWKEIRISLRELYIASLASMPMYKKILGKRLTRNYARLAESFLLKDREPENSIILFSVQLLTVPSVSDLLVNDYYFFGLICSTLTAFFLTDHLGLLLPSDRARLPSRINCESRAFRTRRYFNAFHDLRYIMNVTMIKQVLAEDPLYLRQYVDLIGLFQGMNAQVCQKDTHVEYESEIWVNAFNVTLQIAKCCRQFADCFGTLPLETREQRVLASKILVRALSRVLQKIVDWGIDIENISTTTEETVDGTTGKPKTASPTVYISGIQSRAHHTITLPNMAPLEVVDYSVTSQPVSFHHPLHWLLAGLLEHAHILDDDVLKEAGWSNGFYEAICVFSTTANQPVANPDVLLPILDYPIRTIVFSSQIRAGVWVRNGYGLRTQAHHYREISLRENTYDADIFLLQLGFVAVGSNILLATLMDRFDLVNWFQGVTKHEQYDSTQTVFMAEEILNVLIVCICEHSNILGVSMQDKIRREIIHNLCLGLSSYSELTKRIPERLTEHPDFDQVLSQVANFKAPDGIHDHGRYELKDECFDEVDTYFWHYSRNNREEVENVLKARWKKANPDKPDDAFFVLPKTGHIPSGPFKYLGSILHTPVMVQMLAYALWNDRGKSHNSDTILDQSLHLVMLALIDTNHRISKEDGFYRHAFEQKYEFKDGFTTQHLSLFDVMTLLREDDEYKEVHGRFDWIFHMLETQGFDITRDAVQQWRNKNNNGNNSSQPGTADDGQASETSEYEKKKQAARERQKKIMAQFAKAQSQFMENNEGLYDDEGDDMDDRSNFATQQQEDAVDDDGKDVVHRFCAYPVGTCIVCQEDVHERSAPYGLLGLFQTSNIMRETPMESNKVFNDALAMGPTLDNQWPDQQVLPDDHSTIPGFPSQLHKTGLYASSCGHLMHIKCFDVYCTSIDSRHSTQLTRNHPENRSRKEFMCPLCKSLGNALLPLFWKGKKESSVGPLTNANDVAYGNFIHSGGYNHIQALKQTVGPVRVAFNQGRRSSGASKLKETLATWLVGEDRTSRRAPSSAGFSLPSVSPLDTSSPSSSQQQDESSSSFVSAAGDMPSNGNLGPFDSDILHSSAIPNMSAIKKSYSRLFDILAIIHQEVCGDEATKELSAASKNVDLLWGMFGYTINGVEIATRGLPNTRSINDTTTEYSGTFFDQIPQQTQMLLRILGDTVNAYTTLMCQPDLPNTSTSSSSTLNRVHVLALGRMKQIFTDASLDDLSTFSLPSLQQSQQQQQGQERLTMYENNPLLDDDPFMILVELSLHMVPATQIEIYPLIRVLFLAEITKTVVALIENRECIAADSFLEHQVVLDDQEKNAMAHFVTLISDNIQQQQQQQLSSVSSPQLGQQQQQPLLSNDDTIKAMDMGVLSRLTQSFVLPFLRRSLLLMITKFGFIALPRETADGMMEEDEGDISELDRLLRLLRLPSWTEMLIGNQTCKKDQEKLVQSWCYQHVREVNKMIQLQEIAWATLAATTPPKPAQGNSNNGSILGGLINTSQFRIVLDLPTPLYLVPLPSRLDRLFDESLQRICQKCGTVPSDPALCLFCGTFVCCQSFCCSEDEEGECNLHTLDCGGDIGIFLSVKRCVLILLHNGNGWFMNAPYLDTHGEVDQGLRRGRPQYLNTKRYSEIRKLWLQHNIPIYVARQIEATYDIGGWTTL